MRRICPSHLGPKLVITMLMGGILLLWIWLNLPCLFRTVTGLPCPGCGMSRAWMSVAHLDFSVAVSYHPMFWSVPVFWVFMMYDLQLLKSRRVNAMLIGVLIVGFLGCYLIRLVAYLRGEIVF